MQIADGANQQLLCQSGGQKTCYAMRLLCNAPSSLSRALAKQPSPHLHMNTQQDCKCWLNSLPCQADTWSVDPLLPSRRFVVDILDRLCTRLQAGPMGSFAPASDHEPTQQPHPTNSSEISLSSTEAAGQLQAGVLAACASSMVEVSKQVDFWIKYTAQDMAIGSTA